MEVLYLLIPLAVILMIVMIGIFLWAIKSRQFDDLDRHGHNVLMDDDKVESNESRRG